jgi:hypothetical protein
LDPRNCRCECLHEGFEVEGTSAVCTSVVEVWGVLLTDVGRNTGTREGKGQARLSRVVESSDLTSDLESDLGNPLQVTVGEMEPEFSPPLDPKPPGQFRDENPGQVSLVAVDGRGEMPQPPLCSPFWRRALAEFDSDASMVQAVQRVRDGIFALASSFRDIVVESLTKETMPCLQRGQGIDPVGLDAVEGIVFVEQR